MNAVKMILILVLSLFAICGAVMPRIEVDGSGGIDVFEERVEMNEDYYSNRLGDDLDSVELTLDEMSGSGEGLDGTRVQQLMGSDYVAGFDDPIFEGELDEEDKKDLEMLTKVKSLRSVGPLVESKSSTIILATKFRERMPELHDATSNQFDGAAIHIRHNQPKRFAEITEERSLNFGMELEKVVSTIITIFTCGLKNRKY